MVFVAIALLAANARAVASQQARDTAYVEYRSGVSLGFVSESDVAGSDLRGLGVAFVAFSRGPQSPHGFAGAWFLELKRSPEQRVVEGGVELAWPYFTIARFGIGPRARVALQRRAAAPDAGFDGVIGAGAEAGVWLVKDRLQLAALALRSVGLRVPARTMYAVALRAILWQQ